MGDIFGSRAVRVKYAVILYLSGGGIQTYRTSRKRRFSARLMRDNWEEAHIVATYSTAKGVRIGTNRFVVKSKEDVASTLNAFDEQELLDFLSVNQPQT